MHRAVDEMGTREGFHGYGPEQGYELLRHAIAENDYRAHGLDIADDEIFVCDGSKCDSGNILDILGAQNRIAVIDPVYPGLRGYERDGRPHRRRGRARRLRRA